LYREVIEGSPGCARTYCLIDRTVPLVDRLIRMSRLLARG
jgi:hypothetical protein